MALPGYLGTSWRGENLLLRGIKVVIFNIIPSVFSKGELISFSLEIQTGNP
jgi:hypothetical protein